MRLGACAFSRISRRVNTASRRVGGLYQVVWTAVLSYFRVQVDEMAGGWSDEATRALIEVWGDTNVQSQLDGFQRNQTIYERIAREMEKLGYTKTWMQCRTKVKNLTAHYRKVRGQLYCKTLCTKPMFLETIWKQYSEV